MTDQTKNRTVPKVSATGAKAGWQVTQRGFTDRTVVLTDTQTLPCRVLTSRSGEASVACFLRLASLDSFSVSRTNCLMKPPGMTEKRGGGEDGGGLLSSSRICFAESKKEESLVSEPAGTSCQSKSLQWSLEGAEGDMHDQAHV